MSIKIPVILIAIAVATVSQLIPVSPCFSFDCDLSISNSTLIEELNKDLGASDIISVADLDKNSKKVFEKTVTSGACPGITWVGRSSKLYLLLRKDNETLLIKATPLDSETRPWVFTEIDNYKDTVPFVQVIRADYTIWHKNKKQRTDSGEALRIVSPGNYSYVYVGSRVKIFE